MASGYTGFFPLTSDPPPHAQGGAERPQAARPRTRDVPAQSSPGVGDPSYTFPVHPGGLMAAPQYTGPAHSGPHLEDPRYAMPGIDPGTTLEGPRYAVPVHPCTTLGDPRYTMPIQSGPGLVVPQYTVPVQPGPGLVLSQSIVPAQTATGVVDPWYKVPVQSGPGPVDPRYDVPVQSGPGLVDPQSLVQVQSGLGLGSPQHIVPVQACSGLVDPRYNAPVQSGSGLVVPPYIVPVHPSTGLVDQQYMAQGIAQLPQGQGQVFGAECGAVAAAAARDVTSPNHFQLLSVLGTGGFGKVFLVRKTNGRDAGVLYAMKVMRKFNGDLAKKEGGKFLEHILNERQVLEKIQHPFLVELVYAVTTDTKLYLVLQYAAGGELYVLMNKGTLTEDHALFYVSEMVLALSYLHGLHIIYRDLKPENILLDAQGHIKLTDMGFAVSVENTAGQTNTFCGTKDYMAPEVHERRAYCKEVDWWSVGIVLHEMVTGQVPFRGGGSRQIMHAITNTRYRAPRFLTNEAKAFLCKLLKKRPDLRLGHGPQGSSNVMRESVFRNVVWDDLLNKRVKPPFVPQLKSEQDTSHFDAELTCQPAVDSVVTEKPELPDPNYFRGFSYTAPSLAATDQPPEMSPRSTVESMELSPQPAMESTMELPFGPSIQLTEEPTTQLTVEPSIQLIEEPATQLTVEPSIQLTVETSAQLTVGPSIQLTVESSTQLTVEPSTQLTIEPSTQLSVEPSIQPELAISPSVKSKLDLILKAVQRELRQSIMEVGAESSLESALELPLDSPPEPTMEPPVEPATGPSRDLSLESAMELTVEQAVGSRLSPAMYMTMGRTTSSTLKSTATTT